MKRKFGINTIAYQKYLKEGMSQSELLPHIQSCGAQIAEIRREWIRGEQLERIAKCARESSLTLYYSVPAQLFENGSLNLVFLQGLIDEANRLEAKAIKLTLGDSRGAADSDIERLCQLSRQSARQILVENDQSGASGDAELLDAFFKRQNVADSGIALTFDTGNFLAAGFDPVECANRFSAKTDWIHLKDISKTSGVASVALLGEGEVDIPAILSLMRKETPAAIEYPCGDYEQVRAQTQKAIALLSEFD